jgi:hypothetical protein
MFDLPFDFFSLLIAIVAFIFARKAFNQAAALRVRLDAIEAAGLQARPGPPPLTPLQEREQTLATSSPGVAPEQQVTAADAEPLAPEADDNTATPQHDGDGAAPPPLPQPSPGFEERIGTRWVVWVGGLTLALGGFFMVRYSIDAGLLGPGVRTLLGGAFAIALLAAGEWTRRKESISTIEALPIANIPAILTAAGTAVAFATVYAAYALYDFLAPATAFVLLGLVALGTLAAALLHGPALAASASPPPSSRRSLFLLKNPISGRSTSISPSSPRRRSDLRGSGCGAGSRSPPLYLHCSGPFPACNAARRWSARMLSTSCPGFSSRHCWWCADSCSVRPPTKAGSSQSHPARSRATCWAQP